MLFLGTIFTLISLVLLTILFFFSTILNGVQIIILSCVGGIGLIIGIMILIVTSLEM